MSLIKLENITKKFGERVVIDGISLDICEGDFISIMGKSGCGKSTLLSIIGLGEGQDSGKYFLSDSEITLADNAFCAGVRNTQIGFVFQMFNLEEKFLVKENVEIPLLIGKVKKAERLEKVANALKAVGMHDRQNDKVAVLSGGEKQRVAIARALVNNPKIILADEATGNLDEKTGAEIMALFREINKNGTTIIMVTHDAENAGYAQKRYIMKDGKLQNCNS